MNAIGQLGTGTIGFAEVPTDLPFAGIRGVAPGGRHSCFLLDDGRVRCVGRGDRGQLGNGAMLDSIDMVDATVIGAASEVQAGPQHTCAMVGSDLACWGCTSYIGAGNCGTWDPAPVMRSFPAMPLHVDTNFRHTCAVLADGHVGCFGQNFNGELGGGTNPEPGIVDPGVTGVTQVAVGQRHTCTLSDGVVSCFGFDGNGQLGNGTVGSGRTPMPIAGGLDVVQLDAGQSHTCAVTRTGEVWCWGMDNDGQVGGAITADKQAPVQVMTDSALQVAASRSTTCALTTAGIKCWGSDADGQLGDGPPRATTRNPLPVDVAIACP